MSLGGPRNHPLRATHFFPRKVFPNGWKTSKSVGLQLLGRLRKQLQLQRERKQAKQVMKGDGNETTGASCLILFLSMGISDRFFGASKSVSQNQAANVMVDF